MVFVFTHIENRFLYVTYLKNYNETHAAIIVKDKNDGVTLGFRGSPADHWVLATVIAGWRSM